MSVIETEALTKSYRNLRGETVTALHGLDLRVDAGCVHGFLGPNGSGKTSAIRCLLGLARPSAGRAQVLGQDVTDGLHHVIDRVGAIVEEPKFAPWMSGRRNLTLAGALARIPATQVDEMLELVGLAERADDPYGAYSLGMRQRLAVAGALLRDPELVILDEPANGLDPAGIRAIRELLGRLAAEGRTVFVSSHQLSEIEQTCDQVTIIGRGRRLASGSVAEVLNRHRSVRYLVECDDPAAARAALADHGFDAALIGSTVVVADPAGNGAAVNRALAAVDLHPETLVRDEPTLEDVYLELTAGDDSEAAS